MQLVIDNITIEITKKDVAYIEVYVDESEERVDIIAPYDASDQLIEIIAREKVNWIKSDRIKEKQPEPKVNLYKTGDTLYVFGQPYKIELQYHKYRFAMRLEDGKAILQVRENSTIEQQERYINEWYKNLLKREIKRLMTQWQQQLDIYAQSWQIKKLNGKWGYCKPNQQKLGFSLKLAKQPLEFVELIVVHELLHLQVPNHGPDFIALLDQHIPEWQRIELIP